jgi:DNA mismatch repair protein MutL
MRIRQLPDTLVNQIAAGEVIERPAAVLRELVENALDAGATRVHVDARDGGKSYLAISDNGIGMTREELVMAMNRHATSKLLTDSLDNITTLGFRGEALPSIGAVSRMKIASRARETPDTAWEIRVEGGKLTPPTPSAHPEGTKIEVRDLFYATPARLKFLKGDRAEYSALKESLIRLAMAFPHVEFKMTHNGASSLFCTAAANGDISQMRRHRLEDLLGTDFTENTLTLNAERDGAVLSGFIGLPTYHRGTSQFQYLFVNGRPVRDKLMSAAVRVAYMDVLARDRHAVAALFLDVPSNDVDMNVHPAKAEVRFRDAAFIRGMMISAMQHCLHTQVRMTATTLSRATQSAMAPIGHYSFGLSEGAQPTYSTAMPGLQGLNAPSARMENTITATTPTESVPQHPLGTARAQLHENYIIAQTQDGMVIVDQHAAHERLTYERLKSEMNAGPIPCQGLLVPEIVTMPDTDIALLLEQAEFFKTLGLLIEPFGPDALCVRGVPAILSGRANVQTLIRQLRDDLIEHDDRSGLEARMPRVGTVGAGFECGRNERAPAADGGNPQRRPVQPWAPDLYKTITERH